MRFHDDEPEEASYEEESDESSFEVRATKKRRIEKLVEVESEDQQEYKLRSKRTMPDVAENIEQQVEIKRNVKPLK